MSTMNFWEAQRQARKRTALYVAVFIILTLIVAYFAEEAMRTLAPESYSPPLPAGGEGPGVGFPVQ